MTTLTLNRPMRPVSRIAMDLAVVAYIHAANRRQRTWRYRDRSAHLGARFNQPMLMVAPQPTDIEFEFAWVFVG